MDLMRQSVHGASWFATMLVLSVTTPALATEVTTSYGGETIRWTISDDVRLGPNHPPGTNGFLYCQGQGPATWPVEYDRTVHCFYEAEFPPVFFAGGFSQIQVSASMTPKVRFHYDSLSIDIGGLNKSVDCGYDCVLVCASGVPCPWMATPHDYTIANNAPYYPSRGNQVPIYNRWRPAQVTMTYRRFSRLGMVTHTFIIVIVPTEKQGLEIARCSSCKGAPKREYTEYIGKPYWQGMDVPLRDPRTPTPGDPLAGLADTEGADNSGDDASGTPDNRQENAGEGVGTCSTQGLPVYWVNTATLNLAVKDSDFAYQTLGPDVSMSRVYNLDPSRSGMFGRGWSFSYDSLLSVSEGGTYVLYGDGSGALFTGNASAATPLAPVELQNPAGVYDRLYSYGTYWVLKTKQTKWSYRYDLVGAVFRLTSITDRNGNTLAVGHHPDGSIQAITDAAGRITTFQYAGSPGLCTSMTTPDGRVARYAYDGGGFLINTTDFIANTVEYQYDSDGFMASMRLGAAVTTMTYSSADNSSTGWKHLSSIRDARGQVTSYVFTGLDSSGLFKVTVTNPTGAVSQYQSYGGGLTTSVQNALGGVVSTAYVSAGSSTYTDISIVTRTDARGGTTQQKYDVANLNRGNIVEYTDARGAKQTFVYDADDHITSVTDALNHTTSYAYDQRGNLVGVTLPSTSSMAITRDEHGQVTAVRDFNGNTTFYSYDRFGNVSQISEPLGRTTTFEYEPRHGLSRTAVIDPLGNRTSIDYDANHRVTKVRNPDGTVKTMTYDGVALVAYTDEDGHTFQLRRDPLLNIVGTTDPRGGTSSRTYDGNSNLATATDALSHTISYAYDAAGRLSTMTDPGGHSLVMEYDSSGNLASLTDPLSHKTTYSYDAGRLLQSVTDPLLRTVANSRDALGRVIRHTNGRGGTVGFVYDVDGRVTEKLYDGVSVATYGFDRAANLTSVSEIGSSSNVRTQYVRDALNQVTAIHYPDANQVLFSYDRAGNVLTATYPGGLLVTYSYTNRNAVGSVSWDGRGITYTYDAAGNLVGENRAGVTESVYTLDANNGMTEISHRKGGVGFARMVYVRNAAGHTDRETVQLPVYPAMTNGAVSATYDAGNQIVRWGADSYVHDPDGNLLNAPGGRAVTASYNQQNRITSLTLNGGATTRFGYDGLGNRTSAVIDGGSVTKYYYDHRGRLLFEADRLGNVLAYYIYRDDRLVATKQAGASYFYHFDKTGNTVAMTNEAGVVVNAYAYTPFGEITKAAESVRNPFTYVGALGVVDDGNNLYFMTNRTYDAVTGRFLQRDPASLAGGQTNLYSYVGNNPVDTTDSLGLGPADLAIDAAFFIGDKAMNAAPERPGFLFAGAKMLRLVATSGGRENENAARIGIEMVKVLIGGIYGPAGGFAADLYQDAFEFWFRSLKTLAEKNPGDLDCIPPRWGKPCALK